MWDSTGIVLKNQFNPFGKALLVTGLSPKYSLGLESKPLSSVNLNYFKDSIIFILI